MIRLKSLQQRFTLFLLVPVALLLTAMGVAGFIYARDKLLEQWRVVTVLRLQRTAHQVDMRLSRVKEWLQMYHATAGEAEAGDIQDWIVEQLERQEGVVRVNLSWNEPQPGGSPAPGHHPHDGRGAPGQGRHGKGKMRFYKARVVAVTPPQYDSLVAHETVSLISDLNDEAGATVGKLEVVIRFDYLAENVLASGWWQRYKAFLVDDSGRVLTCTVHGGRHRLGETNDPVELATLEAMKVSDFGTLLGRGHPSHEVAAFSKLQEAPWSVVVIAPGRDILALIIRFRLYYFLTGMAFIVLILVLMRWVTGNIVASIRDVSQAAGRIASGTYDNPLPVKRADEVGELISSFNTMALQLEERIRLKEALDLAMEVQQSLLPGASPKMDALDIAGKSIYCDQTGGDYYDFLQISQWGRGQFAIAVGDVVGHGIAAALLMTTVRSLLRCRLTQPGSLAEIMTDVNRLLCFDTAQTGNFMTLFVVQFDLERRELRWVRAGHDPAMVYNAAEDRFDELHGSGIALGVDPAFTYQEYSYPQLDGGQIILIGTDGIWETENPENELFGKDRLREIIRRNSRSSSSAILEAITTTLADFRHTAPQRDDITLVVAKTKGVTPI